MQSLKRSKINKSSGGKRSKSRHNSKEAKCVSPKHHYHSQISRNLAKIYCSSRVTSPNFESKRRTDTCRSTPKKIGRRNNSNKMSHSHRGIFLFKKSAKGKSKAPKNSKLTQQQTFLDFLLKSTNNPVSFTKEVEKTHARSQFTYHGTRTQGTTNGATMKDTISPQSTNYIGTTRIMNSNQKYISDLKNTWEEACKAFIKHPK